MSYEKTGIRVSPCHAVAIIGDGLFKMTGLSEGKKVRLISICLFSFIIYIYLLSQSLPGIYFLEHHFQRYEVTKSIVERFDLSIPEGSEGVTGTDGRTYSLYGLGWSILAVPFYLAGRLLAPSPDNFVLMLNPLAGAVSVTLVFLFSVALGYTRRSSLAVAIFYGLGSMAWPLAKQPFDHTVETLFILCSAYFMYLHVSQNKQGCLVYSAISIGIAMNTRLTSSMVIPGLFFMLIWKYVENRQKPGAIRELIMSCTKYVVVLLPFIGLVFWYNRYRFGSVFETGFHLFAIRSGLNFFSGTPFLTGLRGLLISPGKGLFFYSPIMILSLLSIRSFWKKHFVVSTFFIYNVLVYILFISKNIYWHGDWAWGPRYLLPITPFLIIVIADFLDSDMWLANKWPIVVPVYFIFTLSMVIQVAAVSVSFCNYFLQLRVDDGTLFSARRETGIPALFQPSSAIYFEWKKSPILQQFLYMYDIGKRSGNNEHDPSRETIEGGETSKESIPIRFYYENPGLRMEKEKIMDLLPMKTFDLWWVYLYVVERRYIGFIVVSILFGMTALHGNQLISLSKRET